jgi:glycosyltransferase involved in cell wall biosynthesis
LIAETEMDPKDMSAPRIALLCSGLDHIHRGHEVFARALFDLLKADMDITLFKGSGDSNLREISLDAVHRDSPKLDNIRVASSPKWEKVVREEERCRIEHETFAYAAFKPLIEGEYDIVHCLEREVCEILYSKRHLLPGMPKIVFSNGGAIPRRKLPPCDFVQEHTEYNRLRSDTNKAFMIPHGVDVERFRPDVSTDVRARFRIPADAFLVISVGTICYHHKRMDYVIREVARLPDAHLLIIGQENGDSPEIKATGKQLMGDRLIFSTFPHDELPKAYAAADAFVLGSLFETFGIVYIEAMAMGLPVFCTEHPNQRSIVQEGIFVDMAKDGALSKALSQYAPEELKEIGNRGRAIALRDYDIRQLKKAYLRSYGEIAQSPPQQPRHQWLSQLAAKLRNNLSPV